MVITWALLEKVAAPVLDHAGWSVGVKFAINALAELKTLFVLYKFFNLGCSSPISVDKPETWFCVKVIEETAVLLTFPSPREEAVMTDCQKWVYCI